MSNPLIPQPFWFRVANPCFRDDAIPRPKGRLLDLADRHLAFAQETWQPSQPWVRVRTAWNMGGLAFGFEHLEKLGPISPDLDQPSGADSVQLWVDTRDTRNVHRATRFCHRFVVTLRPGSGRAIEAVVARKPIARAIADAPSAGLDLVQARADRTASGWRLDLFFPAESLSGFDPESNRRLGWAYAVSDPDRGEAFSGVGREFPFGEDPSLWASLVLEG